MHRVTAGRVSRPNQSFTNDHRSLWWNSMILREPRPPVFRLITASTARSPHGSDRVGLASEAALQGRRLTAFSLVPARSQR